MTLKKKDKTWVRDENVARKSMNNKMPATFLL